MAAAETVSRTDQVLAVILEKALAAAEKTGQFVLEQAPDVIQQLLLFNAIESGLYTILGLIWLVSIPVLVGKVMKFGPEAEDHKLSEASRASALGKCILYSAAAALGVFIGPILFFCNVGTFIKILVAPKVWLIEYASTLLR